MTKDDELRIIDACIQKFEQALMEGKVQCNSLADINTVLRLKKFIEGGADSRAEVQTGITLETLQARHERMLRIVEGRDLGKIPDKKVLTLPAAAEAQGDTRAEPASDDEEV